MATCLALARDIADELSLQRPASLFAAYDEGDTSDVKLKRALIKTARFIHSYWDWPHLKQSHSFTSTTNGPQTGGVPADFHRIVKGSGIDQTNKWPVVGPISFEKYREMSLMWAAAIPNAAFSIQGTTLLLVSRASVGATISYSYVRDVRAFAADTTPKAIVTADTDTFAFDDELMHLGALWAYNHRDGRMIGEDWDAFNAALQERMTNVADGDTLNTTKSTWDVADPVAPWTGWALTTDGH